MVGWGWGLGAEDAQMLKSMLRVAEAVGDHLQEG